MEKLMTDDGTYKIIYKLPSNSVLEFDFSFKKGENVESAMMDNFTQEKIPKIIVNDISVLMKQMINEERKICNKNIFQNEKQNLNSKAFLSKVINEWLSIKTFKNHIECNILLIFQ
jgi:hypothetical protein